jgi:hypothetical protein
VLSQARLKNIIKEQPKTTKINPPIFGHFQAEADTPNTTRVKKRCDRESCQLNLGLNPSKINAPKKSTIMNVKTLGK